MGLVSLISVVVLVYGLSAIRLGASEVHSFDYDLDSVKTTQNVKDRFEPNNQNWHIERGDALDHKYMEQLGKYDIVYSWGVFYIIQGLCGRLSKIVYH